MKGYFLYLTCLSLLTFAGCATLAPKPSQSMMTPTVKLDLDQEATSKIKPLADVVSVEVSGEAGAYQFSVGILSHDLGCEQYADWWEVLSETGDLLYRRILLHSHVSEQPFVRSGGPVKAKPKQTLWIRAHMYPTGYGGVVFKGSVEAEFERVPPALAEHLATEFEDEALALLPNGCHF